MTTRLFPERTLGPVFGRRYAGGHGLNVVLVHPQIAPNTGTIGRLCVATDSTLHLIHPLGFDLSDPQLKRAGLDYWPMLRLHEYGSLEVFLDRHPEAITHGWLSSGRPGFERPYTSAPFQPGDWLWFGRESDGLPHDLLCEQKPRALTIPMCGPVRGINLAVSVGIVVYGALARTRPDLFEDLGTPPLG